MAKSSFRKMSEDKKKVLMSLQNNSAESIDKMAKRLEFSRQKVWRIIKRLEASKDVWGYTAILDEEALGLKHFTALVKGPKATITPALMDEIDSCHYIHGGMYDWMFSFDAKDIVEAKKKCNQVKDGEVLLIQSLYVVKEHFVKNPNQSKLLKEIL